MPSSPTHFDYQTVQRSENHRHRFNRGPGCLRACEADARTHREASTYRRTTLASSQFIPNERSECATLCHCFRGVVAVTIISVPLAPWCSRAVRSPVHPTATLALHGWRWTRLPSAGPSTAPGGIPQWRWLVGHSLHGLVRSFHLLPPSLYGSRCRRSPGRRGRRERDQLSLFAGRPDVGWPRRRPGK